MSLHIQDTYTAPEKTAEDARAVFPTPGLKAIVI